MTDPYSSEQLRKLEDIVERAGGTVACDRFNAERDRFASIIRGWKGRIGEWSGHDFGRDETELHRNVEDAARAFRDALTRLHFPAHLIWNARADVHENEQQYADFLATIERVQAQAHARAEPRRKDMRFARDRFVRDLGPVFS